MVSIRSRGALGLCVHVSGRGSRHVRVADALLLVFCGTDPGEFGLGPDDAPPGIDLHKVRLLGETYESEGGSAQGVPESLCTLARLHLVDDVDVVVPLRAQRHLGNPLSAA